MEFNKSGLGLKIRGDWVMDKNTQRATEYLKKTRSERNKMDDCDEVYLAKGDEPKNSFEWLEVKEDWVESVKVRFKKMKEEAEKVKRMDLSKVEALKAMGIEDLKRDIEYVVPVKEFLQYLSNFTTAELVKDLLSIADDVALYNFALWMNFLLLALREPLIDDFQWELMKLSKWLTITMDESAEKKVLLILVQEFYKQIV